MSAADTLALAATKLAVLSPAPSLSRDIERAVFMVDHAPTRRHGTMRAWFEVRRGATVDTLQMRADGRVWMPGPRLVAFVTPTRVVLDTSSTDYARHRVVAADDDSLVVETELYDGAMVTIYRVSER